MNLLLINILYEKKGIMKSERTNFLCIKLYQARILRDLLIVIASHNTYIKEIEIVQKVLMI